MNRRSQTWLLLRPFLLLVVTTTCAADPPSQSLTGKVIAIADGDTIRVLDSSNQQHKIRLFEIDAPETGQAFGTKSREALGSKLHDKTVRIEWKERDQYDRIHGKVYIDDRWINREMVADGWAWHYKHYSKSKELADAEIAARNQRIGLWADAHPVPPWQYRWQQREAEAGKK